MCEPITHSFPHLGFKNAFLKPSGNLGLLSMKVKVKVAQLCLTLCDFKDYTVHGILQARILEWVPFPCLGDPPNLEIEPRSPGLRILELSSLSLLQRIFPTQELNWDLLHCRWILYQLSYQGSMSPLISPCPQTHLDFRLLASRTVKQCFCCFKPLALCYFVKAALTN